MPEFELPAVMQYAIVAPHRDGATSFIITKAFKRVENGDEDSLAFFGGSAAGRRLEALRDAIASSGSAELSSVTPLLRRPRSVGQWRA